MHQKRKGNAPLTKGHKIGENTMITIINKYTGEEITKYSNALVSEATEDSFIANVKGSGIFRSRWNAVVGLLHNDRHRSIRKHTMPAENQFAVKECMKKQTRA